MKLSEGKCRLATEEEKPHTQAECQLAGEQVCPEQVRANLECLVEFQSSASRAKDHKDN